MRSGPTPRQIPSSYTSRNAGSAALRPSAGCAHTRPHATPSSRTSLPPPAGDGRARAPRAPRPHIVHIRPATDTAAERTHKQLAHAHRAAAIGGEQHKGRMMARKAGAAMPMPAPRHASPPPAAVRCRLVAPAPPPHTSRFHPSPSARLSLPSAPPFPPPHPAALACSLPQSAQRRGSRPDTNSSQWQWPRGHADAASASCTWGGRRDAAHRD